MARREERAYREYVSDEQRSQAGCIGGQSGTLIRGRVLSSAGGHGGTKEYASLVPPCFCCLTQIDGTIER